MKPIAAAALTAALVTIAGSPARADDPERPRAEPSSPAADQPTREAHERSDEDTDAFRLGALAGVGFPRPLAFEGLLKIDRVFAFGLEYSLLPKTSFGSVETSFWAIAADARVFPFRNGFFIGLRGGRQVLSASTTVNVGALGAFSESARAQTWFLNPRMGFLWTWKSGLTVGIDAGVQLPISPSLTTTLPDGLSTDADATIASVANTFGNGVTPTIDLLRIGFLF